MNERNYPHLIRDGFIPFVGETEASDRWLLFSAIAGIGSLLERKAYLRRDDCIVMPNNYVMLIGKTGAKKTSAADQIIRLLAKLEDFRISPNQMTPQAWLQEMSKPELQKPVLLPGSTEEVKMTPYFLYCSEFKNFMTEIAKSLNMMPTLTDIYDYSPMPTFESVTKGAGKVQVVRPVISMLACSTPDWLRDSLEDMHSGLASRMILVPDFRPPAKFLSAPKKPNDWPQRELRLLHDLELIYSLTGEFRKTPEASKFYDDWYNVFKPKQFAGLIPGHEFMHRREVHLEKLAMVSSVCQKNDLLIDVANYQEALGWIEMMDSDLWQITADTTNKFYGVTERLLDFIRARGVVRLSELQKKFSRQIMVREVDMCLQDLLRREEININNDGTVSALSHGD